MTYSEIHVWGDSLAVGILYREERGRYAISRERCVAQLEKALSCKVVNHANMGATVMDGLKWFDAFQPVPGALCAVEFGGNDCDLDWRYVAEHPTEPVQPMIPLDAFEDAMITFVRRIRARGMRPVLVTPLPLHAQRYFAWVTKGLDADKVLCALGDVYHIYRWQERYAIAVRNAALRTGCPLLDLRDVFLAQPNYEHLMSLDGIHPNDEGHRLLAEAALQTLRGKLCLDVTPAQQEADDAAATAVPSAVRVG